MSEENLGIKVSLLKDYPIIIETLSRVGIKKSHKKCFYPSCYCLEKDGEYTLYHFKELFILNDMESSFNEIDKLRRNTIAFLLQKKELTFWSEEDLTEKYDFRILKTRKVYKFLKGIIELKKLNNQKLRMGMSDVF